MPQKLFLASALLFLGIFLANTAEAVCPICVVAVGTGVGLCRWLGIDDAISGLWIGGLIISIIIWFLRWLSKKQLNFKFSWLLVSVLFYVLSIWPLYISDIIGHPLNKFLGIDKLLFGIISGSIVFLASHWLNLYLKKKNQGKVYFSYQKIIIPLVFLIIVSITFYFVVKCYY